jgi:hypothetical protein
MRKRNFRIKFHLNEKEAEYLNKRVMRSGLNRSAYLRQLLYSIPQTDALPPDYAAMTEKLRPIGESFNQIARKAHVLNVIDVRRFDETFTAFKGVVAEIMQEIMLARNFGRDESQEKGHMQDE